jgi:hypothetical protein
VLVQRRELGDSGGEACQRDSVCRECMGSREWVQLSSRATLPQAVDPDAADFPATWTPSAWGHMKSIVPSFGSPCQFQNPYCTILRHDNCDRHTILYIGQRILLKHTTSIHLLSRKIVVSEHCIYSTSLHPGPSVVYLHTDTEGYQTARVAKANWP